MQSVIDRLRPAINYFASLSPALLKSVGSLTAVTTAVFGFTIGFTLLKTAILSFGFGKFLTLSTLVGGLTSRFYNVTDSIGGMKKAFTEITSLFSFFAQGVLSFGNVEDKALKQTENFNKEMTFGVEESTYNAVKNIGSLQQMIGGVKFFGRAKKIFGDIFGELGNIIGDVKTNVQDFFKSFEYTRNMDIGNGLQWIATNLREVVKLLLIAKGVQMSWALGLGVAARGSPVAGALAFLGGVRITTKLVSELLKTREEADVEKAENLFKDLDKYANRKNQLQNELREAKIFGNEDMVKELTKAIETLSSKIVKNTVEVEKNTMSLPPLNYTPTSTLSMSMSQ